MLEHTTPIAESNRFIVLDKYTKEWEAAEGYQSESDLERELVKDLVNQGYEFLPALNTPEAMLSNIRVQLQNLNNVQFADGEWLRFTQTYLDKPSDSIVDKTRKIHDDYIHDFVFDDGRIQNIYLLDKKNIARNKVQVIKQFEQAGKHVNRYDVTILVNGLPLVQIELKRRGVAIREAFNQIHRYSKESFNSEQSLYKYVQLFVISNGTDSRYFANTTKRDKNSFDFTMNWAKAVALTTVPVGLLGVQTMTRRVRSVNAARSTPGSSRKPSGPRVRAAVVCTAPARAMTAAYES